MISVVLVLLLFAAFVDAVISTTKRRKDDDGDDVELLNYITCDNAKELEIDMTTPFSHGHSKGVYKARLKGFDVVVKKPIGDFLTVRRLPFLRIWSGGRFVSLSHCARSVERFSFLCYLA